MKKILISIIMTISSLFASAQMPNFSEETRTFFNTPKTYSVGYYMNMMLGPSGMEICKKGESTFTVGSNKFSVKYKDGSGSTTEFTPIIKNVTVLTSNGDVTMPLYICDNGRGIRAIRFEDGSYAVHEYTYNKSTGKYIHLFVYSDLK